MFIACYEIYYAFSSANPDHVYGVIWLWFLRAEFTSQTQIEKTFGVTEQTT